MLTYVVRRLLIAIPTLWGVVTGAFIISRLLPGDPARIMAGLNATQQQVDRLRHQLGLDKPLWVQYQDYMGQLLHGNLGFSPHFSAPVAAQIAQRLPYTAELAVLATAIAVVVGVTIGVLAALRRNTLLDLILSAFAVFGVSMPVYWLGLMLILIFAIDLRALPAAGADSPQSVILPAVTLALFSIGLIARMTRASMLEVLGQDYVRTARAKGAPHRRVVLKHALRNAVLPILTAIGLQFGGLLGGAVLTESVFGWPGVGQLLVNSIFYRDYPMVQGLVLLFGVTYVVINLLVDLMYAYVDPRIRFD